MRSALRIGGSLAVLVAFGIAIERTFDVSSTDRSDLVIWMLAGAILHDAIFLPAYALTDLATRIGLQENALRRVPVINHVRFPVAVSGALLLVYWPSMLDDDAEANFTRVSGRGYAHDPLEAWLWITAGLLAISLVVYLVRWVRASSPHS